MGQQARQDEGVLHTSHVPSCGFNLFEEFRMIIAQSVKSKAPQVYDPILIKIQFSCNTFDHSVIIGVDSAATNNT